LACLFAALAVILGAFGAHALKERLDESSMAWWHTGVEYHFYHSLAVLVVTRFTATPWIHRAALAFFAGIVLFSGSLYVMALTGARWLGAVTPVGGLLFLVGWGLSAIALSNEASGRDVDGS